jgi:hypothetical protein
MVFFDDSVDFFKPLVRLVSTSATSLAFDCLSLHDIDKAIKKRIRIAALKLNIEE